MSLRARLVLALAVILGGALLVSGALLAHFTRVALVDRIDQELVLLTTTATRIERLGELTSSDASAGRRLAVMRLDENGNVTNALPSGFASDPDPLPVLPVYDEGIPADAYGKVVTRSSEDGTLEYRVITSELGGGGKRRGVVAIAAPMATIDEAQNALVRTMLVVGTSALLLTVALAWLVIRRGLLPLERMTSTAEEISKGDLSHRAGIPRDASEVGRLGAAFDTMLDRVEDAFDEQRAALDAKARSEEQLRRFVADASHELRTPLTSVRGYADLYRAGGLADPAELERAMERISTESRRMSDLVEDLLLLARLDQGRPLRRDVVDLSRLADEAVADARAVEPGRPITSRIEDAVFAIGDEDRVRQVIANLLANVRVHTPASCPVDVAVTGDGAWAEVRVADRGPGIDPAQGARVFDRFYRADKARSRQRGGAGLGLSIVASLVHAQGGVVGHEPTPGGGATFVVRLPSSRAGGPISQQDHSLGYGNVQAQDG